MGRMLWRHPSPGTGRSCKPRIVKHANHLVTTTEKRKKESSHALYRLAEQVFRVEGRLAAQVLVTVDGAQIVNLHDNTCEWALGAWRVRVRGAGHLEAPPTRIPGTEARRSTEGKQAHRRGVAGGCFATRWRVPILSVCDMEARLAGLTRIAAARVKCKRCGARILLHVAALRSRFEERSTVHCTGKKGEPDEDENRFHCGWWYYYCCYRRLSRVFS
jgi:hypothetical protein